MVIHNTVSDAQFHVPGCRSPTKGKMLLPHGPHTSGKGIVFREASASDDDCMFLAGAVDCASCHIYRPAWHRLAEEAATRLQTNLPVVPPATASVTDSPRSDDTDSPGSDDTDSLSSDDGIFLEYCRFIIQHDAASWYHYSNAIIACDQVGNRLYAGYMISPKEVQRFKAKSDTQDAVVQDDLMFWMLSRVHPRSKKNEGDVEIDASECSSDARKVLKRCQLAGINRIGICFSLAAASVLADLPQLQRFRNVVMPVSPSHLLVVLRQVMQDYMAWHGLDGLCLDSTDRGKKVNQGMGFEVVRQVFLPDSGQNRTGMICWA